MGLYADTINKVFDVLETERTSGSLTHFPRVYFGERDQVTTLAHPYIWVHLGVPAITEAWHAAKDSRNAVFIVAVNVAVRPTVAARPYGVTGDVSKRGVLVELARIMDILDANRAGILGANLKNYDMNLDVVTPAVNLGDNTLEQVIALTVLERFFAAGRST